MIRTALLITLILVFFSTQTYARTNLPLPRFVTVKSSEANVRAGPGLRYQIKWVIVRKNIPVEIIAEFEQWRKIRDIQGDEGWIHRSMLSGARTAIVSGKEQTLHKSSSLDSHPIARAETGVEAELIDCEVTSCLIEVGDYKGWIDRNSIWGVYPDEMN